MSTSLSKLNSSSSHPERGSVDVNSSVNAVNAVQLGAPAPVTPAPVTWLRALPQNGVLLCTEHQICFTPGQHLRLHTLRKHSLTGKLAKDVESWVHDQNIALTVTQPPNHSPFISQLQFYQGFSCVTTTICQFLSTSEGMIQRHCSKEHHINTRYQQKERLMYHQVILQCFFAKPKATDYWIVRREDLGTEVTPENDISNIVSHQVTPAVRRTHNSNQHDRDVTQSLTTRFNSAIKADKNRYQQLGEPNHISEITPWLRKSAMHRHLAELSAEAVAQSHATLKAGDDNSRLQEIVWSVERILHRAYELVPDLLHVDARVLNTFQAGTITQDPFQMLQNKLSFHNYVAIFQALLCYYIRVFEGHFDREMFVITDAQAESLASALSVSEKLVRLRAKDSDKNTSEISEFDTHSDLESEEQLDQLLSELDHYLFIFCTALIQHKIIKAYDSAIMSFLAVRSTITSHEDNTITFRPEAQIAGLLSKLIYSCQLILLQDAHYIKEFQQRDDVEVPLRELCQQWVINNTRGPIGVMSDWRLYTMRVGGATIPEALVVWDPDGQNLTYGDTRYGITDLATEMGVALQEMKRIFHEELCLGLPDVPTFPLRELQDNWANNRPGYSFVEDPRNLVYFEGCHDWLIRQISQKTDLLDLVFHTEQDEFHEASSWPVRSEFARQYEVFDKQFKEAGMVALHKGSGQPARRVEFLGIRWRNSGLAVRNLRLIFEYCCFVLTYHKAQTRTHASRSPVRFIFPEVAQLLVQYLAIVQPFRIWLSQQCNIPEGVGDYLFNDGVKTWPEKHMTNTLTRWSRQSLGRSISPKVWRQIAVAIAVKYFSGLKFEGDTDIAGDDDDNVDETTATDGISLPASFHAQTAHSGRTGNRIYGGRTINFAGQLTDAGVQAYLWTSRLWWTLFEREIRCVRPGKRLRPHSMQNPDEVTSTLVHKITYRTRVRHHRTWSPENVRIALRQLFRDPHAQFKTAIQQQMVETVASRYPEVIVVMKTGGGKSLAFMVPALLPQAATTVVVMPLVVLKQDMVRRFQDANMPYSIWSGHGSSERFNGMPVVFVSAEQAVRQAFRTWIGLLDANRQLDRVVFDEAHLILTSQSYRPKMALLRFLRELRCSVVFLTATLPPVMMSDFGRRMFLDQPRVIRDVTFRSDIRYVMQVQPREPEEETFDEWVRSIIQNILIQYDARLPNARCIIYIENREGAERLAELVGCEFYHSQSGTPAEKEQVLRRWRQGEFKVIVGTSAFGMGVDYAHVRNVFHYDLPSDAINFAQEVGRVGRDGGGGVSTVLLPRHVRPVDEEQWAREKDTTPLAKRVMQRYMDARCLRAVLSRYVDGAEQMQYCTRIELRCSFCRLEGDSTGSDGLFDAHQHVDRTPWWDAETSRGGAEVQDPVDHETDFDHETGSEEAGEFDSHPAYQAGGGRLAEAERNSGYRLQQYIRRLRQYRDICFICRLLHDGSEFRHRLDACRRQGKFQFFDAKRRAIQQSRGGSWMNEYTACWGCGQPPLICDSRDGVSGCEFRDMVLPAGWAVFHMRNRWGLTLTEFSGQSREFSSEDQWMAWLGEEVELFGDRGIQAARVLNLVLEKVEEGEIA